MEGTKGEEEGRDHEQERHDRTAAEERRGEGGSALVPSGKTGPLYICYKENDTSGGPIRWDTVKLTSFQAAFH